MKIMASFDDGTVEDIRLAELLDKYDIYAIFYFPVYGEIVNEKQGRTSLSKGQRKTIAKSFEIGSHTLTHPKLTRIRPAIAWSEISHSRKYLQDEFGQDVESFAYPRGYANPELQVMVKEAGYTNARSTLVGYIHESENPFFTQTTVHVGYNRKEYAGKTWLEYAKHMLNQALKTPDSVYHLFGHSWEIDKNDGWYDLEELFKELHASTHS